jgi:hypothetical protein
MSSTKRPKALKDLTKTIVRILQQGDNLNNPPTLDTLRKRHPKWYFDAFGAATKQLAPKKEVDASTEL